ILRLVGSTSTILLSMTAYWCVPTAATPAEAGIMLSMTLAGRVAPTGRVKPDGAATEAVFCCVIQSLSLVWSAATSVKVVVVDAPAPPAPAAAPAPAPAPAPAAGGVAGVAGAAANAGAVRAAARAAA